MPSILSLCIWLNFFFFLKRRKVILQWLETDARMRALMPVYDIKRNLYTAQKIPGLDSKVAINFPFQEDDREKPRDNNYVISIQPTGEVEVDLGALAAYCRSGSSTDPPLRSIQALDIALKYGAQQRYIILINFF